MLLVHFSYIFPDILQKIFIYHDVAIDGFILVSGYTVGKYSLPTFIRHPWTGGKQLLIRTIKLYLVNASLVCTVGLIQFVMTNTKVFPENILMFLADSLLFKNQIGLLHILPTFILLYLYSPLILLLISQGFSYLVILGSALFFFLGINDPLIFNYGAPTIFPVVIWQVFFVVGIFLGKNDILDSQLLKSSNIFLFLLVIFFVVLLSVRHAPAYNQTFYRFLLNFNLEYKKFTLNLTGILFGLSTLFLISSLLVRFWENVEKFSCIFIISIMGKNALFAFFVHVFLAKISEIMTFNYKAITFYTYAIIIVNILVYIYLLPDIDKWLMNGRNNLLSKAFVWLFR